MLELDKVTVRYGQHLAVDGVSLTVAAGEVVVVLGANGAGKSTMLKAIAGMVRAEPGSGIALHEQSLMTRKAHEVTNAGIALVPEGRGVVGRMTVEENLRLGATPPRAQEGEAARMAQVFEIFPRLAERRGQYVQTMSGGEQQMVAIGRALMSAPDLLLLDEPSARPGAHRREARSSSRPLAHPRAPVSDPAHRRAERPRSALRHWRITRLPAWRLAASRAPGPPPRICCPTLPSCAPSWAARMADDPVRRPRMEKF